MATATLEPEVKPRAPQWEMPPIQIGAKVFWYEHANRQRTPQPAIVEDNAGGALAVRLMAGGLSPYKSCVRHIDDPFLVKHPQAAAETDAGGWDYSTEHKEEMARWAKVNARLDALEAALLRRQGKKEE